MFVYTYQTYIYNLFDICAHTAYTYIEMYCSSGWRIFFRTYTGDTLATCFSLFKLGLEIYFGTWTYLIFLTTNRAIQTMNN